MVSKYLTHLSYIWNHINYTTSTTPTTLSTFFILCSFKKPPPSFSIWVHLHKVVYTKKSSPTATYGKFTILKYPVDRNIFIPSSLPTSCILSPIFPYLVLPTHLYQLRFKHRSGLTPTSIVSTPITLITLAEIPTTTLYMYTCKTSNLILLEISSSDLMVLSITRHLWPHMPRIVISTIPTFLLPLITDSKVPTSVSNLQLHRSSLGCT